MKGGYRIIDFKRTALTSGEPATIPDIFEAVTNPYGKALQVTGLVVGDVVYPDFYAVFVADSDVYDASLVIGGNSVEIRIEAPNSVTVTVSDALNADVSTRKTSAKK